MRTGGDDSIVRLKHKILTSITCAALVGAGREMSGIKQMVGKDRGEFLKRFIQPLSARKYPLSVVSEHLFETFHVAGVAMSGHVFANDNPRA